MGLPDYDGIAAVVTRTVEDAKALISERQVQMKQLATSKALEEAINNVRGAVMIAYPMGLPDYDGVRQILEEREVLEGAASLEVLDPEQISLWCFSKELQRDKLLSDYVGKNEKTKVCRRRDLRDPPALAATSRAHSHGAVVTHARRAKVGSPRARRYAPAWARGSG